MAWEEYEVLAAPLQEKACKEVSPRGWARKATSLSANGHLHHDRISLLTLTVEFGASSNANELNWAHP